MGSQRAGHDWATHTHAHIYILLVPFLWRILTNTLPYSYSPQTPGKWHSWTICLTIKQIVIILSSSKNKSDLWTLRSLASERSEVIKTPFSQYLPPFSINQWRTWAMHYEEFKRKKIILLFIWLCRLSYLFQIVFISFISWSRLIGTIITISQMGSLRSKKVKPLSIFL